MRGRGGQRKRKILFLKLVYKLNPLYVLQVNWIPFYVLLSAASKIRKLYKLHLVLEMSSTVTLCNSECEILAYIQDA